MVQLSPLSGIHHVTAVASDPQRNLDFYVGLLGLRLVKVTVNFDMPETYHLYYGDAAGSPGTILTIFAWLGARRGRRGAGQLGATAFAAPRSALDFWAERLTAHGVTVEGPVTRFGEEVLRFDDPDGLALEIVGRDGDGGSTAWAGGGVPAERALRRFHGVTLLAGRPDLTAAFLTGALGFARVGDEGGRARYEAGPAGIGQFVDVVDASRQPPGQVSVGSIHHIAWRTPSDTDELAWRARLGELGVDVTPVRDRTYFHSIYFVEPSGVLNEIATDPPGFAVDEPADQLGTGLKLPPWLEPRRALLASSLPPLRLPSPVG